MGRAFVASTLTVVERQRDPTKRVSVWGAGSHPSVLTGVVGRNRLGADWPSKSDDMKGLLGPRIESSPGQSHLRPLRSIFV